MAHTTEYDKTDVDLETVLETREASRQLVRELDAIKTQLGVCGIAYTQGHILLHIETHGRLTIAELAEMLRLDKSTTSRAVAAMIEQGYLAERESEDDRRLKPVALTADGKKLVGRIHEVANAAVTDALSLLSDEEQKTVTRGMRLYARALARSRLQGQFEIRPIRRKDDEQIARLVNRVLSEFRLNVAGSSMNDDEISAMYDAYKNDNAVYFVVLNGKRVVGGAGLGPLRGGDASVCELRKMYLLPEARGLGLGERLLDLCLDAAREMGCKRCYLETARELTQARAMYEKHGFTGLDEPIGDTGHFRSDTWYALDL